MRGVKGEGALPRRHILFWLETLKELATRPNLEFERLLREADELVAIFVSSRCAARR